MPAVGAPKNTITTQPMVMARPSAAPVVPTTKNRATQRLVVTPNAAAKMTSTSPLPGAPAAATINLPAGMILRCLPPEMLASELSQFESSGQAATEIGLPMNAILNQLPSGKIELPVQDMVALLPPGFLKSSAEIAPYLGTPASLPLMDVVMRIPPDLLSVRPDQRDPTAAAGHMPDPFTEDSLRQNARASSQARIVDESQVAPAEEFVPQAAPTPIAPSPKSFVPPPRNASRPLPLLHQTASLSGRPATPLRSTAPMPGRILPPPVASTGEVPMPRPPQLSASQMLGVPRPSLAPPSVGSTPAGTPSVPRIPSPSTPQIPPVAPPAPLASTPSSLPSAPVASTPPIPAPPTVASSFAATIPMARAATPPAPMPPAIPTVPEIPTASAAPATPIPRPPDTGADELKRLAALAMAQEAGDNPPGSKTDALTPLSTLPVPEKEAPPAPGSTSPEKAFSLPPPPARVEPGFSATSRFGLPESSSRLSETTAVVPAPSAPAPKDTGHLPGRPELTPRSITTRVTPPPPPVPAPAEAPAESAAGSAGTAVNLNNCTAEDLLPIPGISRDLAAAIVQHRDKIG
jgi:hypothetical protein